MDMPAFIWDLRKWVPWMETAAASEWEHFVDHYMDEPERVHCSIESLLAKRILKDDNVEEVTSVILPQEVNTPRVSELNHSCSILSQG